MDPDTDNPQNIIAFLIPEEYLIWRFTHSILSDLPAIKPTKKQTNKSRQKKITSLAEITVCIRLVSL